MSVIFGTNKGVLEIDLFFEKCPLTVFNFLGLCATNYYTRNKFFNIQTEFIAQAGDPTNTGKNGDSIFKILQEKRNLMNVPSEKYQNNPIWIPDETNKEMRHKKKGLLSLAKKEGINHSGASQFVITLTNQPLKTLDNSNYTIFGEVVTDHEESLKTLEKINDALCSETEKGKPLEDIVIREVEILFNPFEDKEDVDSTSFSITDFQKLFKNEWSSFFDCILKKKCPHAFKDEIQFLRNCWKIFGIQELAPDKSNMEQNQEEDEDSNIFSMDEATFREKVTQIDVKQRKLVLEVVGDLPSAEMAPPENVLFVCRLHPTTRDEDLRLVFSSFGKINDCTIIRDRKQPDKFHNDPRGSSLGYSFIEFDKKESCEAAFFKMKNAVIDNRRIHVDFSQSVSLEKKKLLVEQISRNKSHQKTLKQEQEQETHSKKRERSNKHEKSQNQKKNEEKQDADSGEDSEYEEWKRKRRKIEDKKNERISERERIEDENIENLN